MCKRYSVESAEMYRDVFRDVFEAHLTERLRSVNEALVKLQEEGENDSSTSVRLLHARLLALLEVREIAHHVIEEVTMVRTEGREFENVVRALQDDNPNKTEGEIREAAVKLIIDLLREMRERS